MNSKDELEEFARIINTEGVAAALHHLNRRTPHRYTGIYKYQENFLVNLYLIDKFNSEVTRGENAYLSQTYCSLLKENLALQIDETEKSIYGVLGGIHSYSGVLLIDKEGLPYGSLCHFDINRCEPRTNDQELLQYAAPLIYWSLISKTD